MFFWDRLGTLFGLFAITCHHMVVDEILGTPSTTGGNANLYDCFAWYHLVSSGRFREGPTYYTSSGRFREGPTYYSAASF